MYILLILLLSAALCYAVVYPLWLFAVESPQLYTLIIILLAIVSLIAFITRKLVLKYRSYTTKEEKKKFMLRFIMLIVIIVVLITSVCNAISLVFAEKRLIALIIFAAGLAVSLILKKIRARFTDV